MSKRIKNVYKSGSHWSSVTTGAVVGRSCLSTARYWWSVWPHPQLSLVWTWNVNSHIDMLSMASLCIPLCSDSKTLILGLFFCVRYEEYEVCGHPKILKAVNLHFWSCWMFFWNVTFVKKQLWERLRAKDWDKYLLTASVHDSVIHIKYSFLCKAVSPLYKQIAVDKSCAVV